MEHLTTHGAVAPGTGSSAAALKALVFITLSCWFIKSNEDHSGSSGGRGKTFQQCEENFLSVKDTLCTAHGSTQGVIYCSCFTDILYCWFRCHHQSATYHLVTHSILQMTVATLTFL